jgi:hypothetical protein
MAGGEDPIPYRRRLSDDALAQLAARLTERDRRIIALVWEHRVLTTDHIHDLVFGGHGHVRRRLVTLHRIAALDRFRPLRTTGSAPFHYVLGPAGAAVLAAERGIDIRDLGYRRDKTLAIAHNQRLAHIVGVNGFFAALATAAGRSQGRAQLLEWWPERRCRGVWGDIVRPDGYGRWREHDHEVDFFLEYDRGTEPLHRVADKLDAYADLHDVTGIPTHTLFWLPTHRRETALRKLLRPTVVPVATASTTLGRGPADAVWLAVGATEDTRRRLATIDR